MNNYYAFGLEVVFTVAVFDSLLQHSLAFPLASFLHSLPSHFFPFSQKLAFATPANRKAAVARTITFFICLCFIIVNIRKSISNTVTRMLKQSPLLLPPDLAPR